MEIQNEDTEILSNNERPQKNSSAVWCLGGKLDADIQLQADPWGFSKNSRLPPCSSAKAKKANEIITTKVISSLV